MRDSARPASSRGCLAIGLSAVALVSSCGLPFPTPGGGPPGSVVDEAGMNRAQAHLQALEKIADANGGNRASGNPGYEASVDYVVGELRKANLDVSTPGYQLPSQGSEDDEDSDDEDSDSGNAGQARDVAGQARNVIAQSKGGDPRHVVMIGAHLDSVPQGPGIVDDGSGVAAVLEIAAKVAAAPPGGNTVRFALFGSEETDAAGSTAYVKSLSAEERKNIMLYLNVDMIASANGGYLIQGGTGDETEETGPPGSADVARVLIDNLTRTGVTVQRIPFVGDDEIAFLEAGIPSAGAENGDAKKKTAEQARAWGGQAGQVYDPCYHQACDRVDNVNRVVFDRYLRAITDTVFHFAEPRNTLTR